MSGVARVVEPSELSRIGFGCYRVDSRDPDHGNALVEALRAGCNLIDTASNYADGRAEALVGAVLEATVASAFVITKVGYVSPSAAAELERAGVTADRLPRLSSGTPYSLDPAVLRVVLELSRARLHRQQLDAVLLHTPERLTEAGATSAELRFALARAFDFLADEVAAGRLRFYGISSNVVPTASVGDPLDLETIRMLGSGTSEPERLTLLEFPLNLLEREAATDGARRSLIARASGEVRTLVNRPLNALVRGENIRLAPVATEAACADPWEGCVAFVTAQLAAREEIEPWTSFRPMQFLRDNRSAIPDPDLVDAIWLNQIDPFVTTLFDGALAVEARGAFARLRRYARACALQPLAARTRATVAKLTAAGLLDPSSNEPLAVSACRYCLDAGADHVLVGMRQPRYVAELAPLFFYSPAVAAR